MLKTTQITYEVSIEEIQALLAKELGLNHTDIEVTYDIGIVSHDPYDRDPGYPVVRCVKVKTKTKGTK